MIRRTSTSIAFGALTAALTLLGCETGNPPSMRDGGPSTDGSRPPSSLCTVGTAETRCEGNTAVECLADGTEGSRTDCGTTDQVCLEGTGCTLCRPGSYQCTDNDVEVCNADGTAWEPHASCDADAGEMCNASLGACTSPCADAEESNSYIGCEYWPTPVANGVDYSFDFAVVVANPQETTATVTVTRGGSEVASVSVPANGLETIRLPWVEEYRSAIAGGGFLGPPRHAVSALVPGGAYRLRSNLPVTVYQFSPLEYESGGDFSHSNDASLLLPTHVLTPNYIAVAERTWQGQCGRSEPSSVPGFITIVGVADAAVTVTVSLRGRIAASDDGAVSEAGPSDPPQTYRLNQGDVLQLATADVDSSCQADGVTPGGCSGIADMTHCSVSDEYDLTGTEIRATGPVMVIGGHMCAMLPTNRFACDHIEESILPLETWGDDFVVSMTEQLRGEPNIIRVISGGDANTIAFEPSTVHDEVTLGRGEVLEFEATEDFRVSGTGPLMIAQFLVAQNYGTEEPGPDGAGDPGMSFAVPVEQYRSEYTVLAPSTISQNYINVVAPNGVDVVIETTPSGGGASTMTTVSGWSPVDAEYRAARVPVEGGTHRIRAGQPVGVVVYGYARYTSYIYPGGMDLEEINPLI